MRVDHWWSRDPAVIGAWITETQARKLGARARLGTLTSTSPASLTAEDIAAMVSSITDIIALLASADPADKAELYAQLGLRLTYNPGQRTVTPARKSGEYLRKGRVRGASRTIRLRELPVSRVPGRRQAVNASADRWIRRTTTGCVALLAMIAGTVSYLHMHLLVELHGQPGWVAALTPLSVDGMIVAASTTLLADSRSGGRGGFQPWALLAVGSAASLAANVAVAEPMIMARIIAAWPSFSLIAAYELLTRQVRRSSVPASSPVRQPQRQAPARLAKPHPRQSCGWSARPNWARE